jgi:gamma-tubulin complex component 3
MIRAWMTEGELRDPFGEFFVCADYGVPKEELWHRSYFLEIEMVPCFVTLELARKILLTGKSVNFIRLCCPEQDWLPQTSAASPLVHPGDPQTSSDFPGADEDDSKVAMPLAALGERVGQAALLTNRHLVSLMMNQYSLGEHCLALRRFMLLGQGDFVEQLMDAAKGELGRNASEIYRHQLLGVLESALRQSNAQFCHPDILNRLTVKLLAPSDGEKGWDVFLLDYEITSPLHVVFSPLVMQQYDRAFIFLWKLRRVSHALASCWSEHMTLKRHLVSCAQHFAHHAPDLEMELRQTLHKCGCLRNEMHHFVQNIHSYVMCGVLDSSWAKLQAGWRGCADLDQVIAEHRRYLACIEEGAFLSPGTEQVLAALKLLFDHALQFIELHDQVCSSAFEAADVLSGPDIPDGPLPFTRSLAECRAQLDHIGANFLVRLQSLLRTLEGTHSLRQLETDVRFLLCRLDFNSYYKQKSTAPWSDRVRSGA